MISNILVEHLQEKTESSSDACAKPECQSEDGQSSLGISGSDDPDKGTKYDFPKLSQK